MQRSPPEVQGCCPTALETTLLCKVLLEAFESVKFSLATPEARRAVSRRRRVAFEFDILRLQLGVQDHLQVSAGHKSQWKGRSALRAILASLVAREACYESAICGASHWVDQEPCANAASHEVFLRDGASPKYLVRICDRVKDIQARGRAHRRRSRHQLF